MLAKVSVYSGDDGVVLYSGEHDMETADVACLSDAGISAVGHDGNPRELVRVMLLSGGDYLTDRDGRSALRAAGASHPYGVPTPMPVAAEVHAEDTGVRADGSFVVAFDLDDRQEHSVAAAGIMMVDDAVEGSARGALTSIRVNDGGGGTDLTVSASAGDVRDSVNEALGACVS